MKERYSSKQISRIIDQALIFQCSCPAQVCRSLLELRELWAYQMGCVEQTATDRAVHLAIARATERAHDEFEQCLKEILVLEGWDPATLTMPEQLKKALKT